MGPKKGGTKKAAQTAKTAKAAGKKPPGRPRKVKEPVQEEEPAEDAPADDDQADDEKGSGRSEPADDATPMDDADPVEAKATDDAAPAAKEDPPAADGEADDKTKAGGDEPHPTIGTVPDETVRSCLRIVVPSDKAGYVIGPRGKIVAHARKESGCGFHLQETSKTHAARVAVVTCADKRSEPGSFQGVRGVEMVYLRSTEEMIPKDADLNDPPMGARPEQTQTQRVHIIVAASQMEKADVSELATGAGADCEKVVALEKGSKECEALHAALGSIVFPTDRFVEIVGTDAAVRAALTVLMMRLDYRANPPIASEDPLLLIDAPDVKEGYFREKKEKDRLQRARDSHGAGRDGRGRHHPYGGGGRGGGGGGNYDRGPPPRGSGGGGGGDEIRMTFGIDAQFAGGVIGKMGSNVGQIRRESGARITVHESHGKFRVVAIEGTDRQCHDAKHLVQQAVTKQGGGPVGAHRIEPSTGRGGRDGRGRDTAVHRDPVVRGGAAGGGSYYDQYDRRGRGDRGYDRGGYDRGGYDRGGYDRGGYDRGGGYGRDAYYDAQGPGSAYADRSSYPDRGGYHGGGRDAPHYDERDTHRQWLGGDRDGGYNNYQGVQQSHQQQQGWAGQNQQWGGSNQQQSYNNQQPSYHGQQQSYDQGGGYNNNQQGGGNDYYNRGQQQSGYGNQGGQYDQQGDYYSRGQQWGGSRY